MNSLHFDVTEAREQDVAELSDLVNSAYRGDSSREGWTTEADYLEGQRTDAGLLRKELLAGDSRILVLRSPGDTSILACVFLKRESAETCYLGMLTVKPRLQARGIGRFLMEKAEIYARNWGAKRIELSVIQIRESLIEWYERRGYKKTGHSRPFPYGDLQFGTPKRDDLYFVIFEKGLPT